MGEEFRKLVPTTNIFIQRERSVMDRCMIMSIDMRTNFLFITLSTIFGCIAAFTSAELIQLEPIPEQPLYVRNNINSVASTMATSDEEDANGTDAAIIVNSRRPIRQIRQVHNQQIPPSAAHQPDSANSPLIKKTFYVVKAQPKSYKSFMVTKSTPEPVVVMRPAKPVDVTVAQLPAPIQMLPNCEMFDPSWRDMVSIINEYRRAKSLPSPIAPLCMNAKLMQACKLQSDFQGLAKLPTHSGPRMSGFGDLEERLRWFGFDKVCPTVDRIDAEELIYYWPAGPRIMPRATLHKRQKEALRAWIKDPRAVKILLAPRYQFFGHGLYRSATGTMFLTVILAASPCEACNVCPDAMAAKAHLETMDAQLNEEYEDLLA